MPKRSRSHQLESESIQRFEQALPSHWVCRRKGEDYGVDLEVEVFDSRGEATGLIFYVQLKATDNPDKALSVSMKTDRLWYLSNLDCPSMIVRYCSNNNTFCWKWLTNVFAEIGQPESETVTIQFSESDAWSDCDPKSIAHTLKVYRNIRLASRQLSIGLSVDGKQISDQSLFELRFAVAEIISGCQIVTTATDPNECLPVTVELDGEYLRVRIDVVSSVSVHLNSFDRHEITAQLSYVLAFMAAGYEFTSQAGDLARLILLHSYRCQSREIASKIAAQLNDYPSLAGDLAALNGLHEQQDAAYLLYIHALLSSSVPLKDRISTISRFYSDALTSHAADPKKQASIHYSFGNTLRISGEISMAVRQYNLARRKYPAYLQRSYFLAELAATLFFSGRYRLAAQLYDQAYTVDAKPQIALCAGDAHLYSGEFAQAQRSYLAATTSEDIFESTEANLKQWLVDWVEQFSHHNQLDSGWDNTEIWMVVLKQSIEADRPDHALGACLVLCYMTEDNLQIWAQAISLSFCNEDHSLLNSVIAASVLVHGTSAYAEFRDRLVESGGISSALRSFDEIVADLVDQRNLRIKRDVTTRLFEGHHYDSVIEVHD